MRKFRQLLGGVAGWGVILLVGLPLLVDAQSGRVEGKVTTTSGEPVAFATVFLVDTDKGTLTDEEGEFVLDQVAPGNYYLKVSSLGYQEKTLAVQIESEEHQLAIVLPAEESLLDVVVVTGTLKPVSRANSPVPVEVFTADYFRANPSPSVFESLQNVNGVRPQLNCNVCNTGDIHINGLEGPYTMVLIDGMPIVSGLSTVYGLTGIPQSLIERMEIVKGPASTLYGSEAVGGLINVITKRPENAPVLAVDQMATSWGEFNTDLGLKFGVGERATSLLGVNYFKYGEPRDDNRDGFTDVTLQDRISVFNKWSFQRPFDRVFSLSARYVYEDRWGGELDYGPGFRGGEEVYGESIYTNRWETFGLYQLPLHQPVNFSFSLNGHYQNSAYGNTIYLGEQYVGFGQLTYPKQLGETHDLLFGAAYRYTWYDDNTPATAAVDAEFANAPSRIHLPGLFVQDEVRLSPASTLLAGLRYDYNSRHGGIFTPRLNYRWSSKSEEDIVRLSLGNGYRVANVFTEDHAALSGARQTVFAETLRPETSWNVNLNYIKKVYTWGRAIVGFDASLWYTRFGNRILPDYETNPNQIIYANLAGHAVSRGGSLNVNLEYPGGFNGQLGLTLQDVYTEEQGRRRRQLLTETSSAVWRISYPLRQAGVTIDYTGNLYGPMELPLLSELDDRQAQSPWFSIQNIQITKKWDGLFEVYGGIKNLLNYTPPANSIARPFDPFDEEVVFGSDGQVLPTPNNPNALSFDPTYVFAPNQGLRFFLGLRYIIEN